ncbi:hypothetical protein Moror_12141 [Moniliophthora roreri MCA 2997]|uniref:Uncharacterized protein n=1 Tax=Moniliophthora roreri (strain MCA 2997) TaxID=1381753 RepID=V2WM57_MONRO|nr:hypothetical protein Moror_12141 [Moniliophthora roreri MCA 2997]
MNPPRPFSVSDLCETRWDGKDKYSWANMVKEKFGYLDSPWLDFFLHGEVDNFWHPASLGDPLSEAAQFILHEFTPYPGDEDRWGSTLAFHIDVFKINENFYEINDFESEFAPVQVPRHLLENSDFQLTTCYTRFKGLENHISNVYEQGLTLNLTMGIRTYPEPDESAPNTSARDQFNVFRNWEDDTYVVQDRVELICRSVPKFRLQDPTFDAITWWRNTIIGEHLKHETEEEEEVKLVEKQLLEKQKCWREKIERQWAYSMKRQGDVVARALENRLEESGPYLGDSEPLEVSSCSRFVAWTSLDNKRFVRVVNKDEIWALRLAMEARVPKFKEMDYSRMGKILATLARETLTKFIPYPSDINIPREDWFFGDPWDDYTESLDREVDLYDNFLHLYMGNLKWEERDSGYVHFLSIAGMNIEPKSYPGLQRTSSLVKAINRIVPKPIVVVVMIDGKLCQALIDIGSLGDFISTQVADQLRVHKQYLEKPLPLHMVVQGSRSKIHCGVTVDFCYQKIKSAHYFDIVNLSGYDIILGTPWLFSHKVRIRLNPSTVEIGSDMKLPIQEENVSEIRSQNIVIEEEMLEATWQELKEYAKPICKTAADTLLPPLCVINHTIPLIDEEKVYLW